MPNRSIKYLILLLCIYTLPVSAQDPGDVSTLLHTKVENWNPVYKPVIGFGVGAFNYMGEIHSPDNFGFNGDLGFKLNVATYIDNKHYFRGNFYLIAGSLSGNQRSYTNEVENFNFKSTTYTFGININYDFDHLIIPQKKLRPFISLGAEIMTFDSKTDSTASIAGEEVPYYYWSDGSIRDAAYADNPNANLIRRDYTYETNITEIDFGLESYPKYTFAVVADAGLDYQVTERVMFRVGTSLHYAFSDEIDHVSHKNTYGLIGDAMNDMFMYSYFTIHLDLFSSDKMLAIDKLFAEVDFDYTLMGDEDGDGIFDGIDNCPGTPFGVDVDTAGCPVDSDLDGIADYLDDEPNSRYGAFVDERGVEMSEDDVIASLDMSKAVDRKDIALYIRTPDSYSHYKKQGYKEIPDKFKPLDNDGDGYLSFDEMMEAIDSFFEFESNLETDDLYELNDFFFAQ